MRLYFVRHTKVGVQSGICYGQSDVRLSNDFKSDFKLVSSRVKNIPESVYSSPLNRCVKLANYLANDPICDSRLMELNFGEWEMKKWADLNDDVAKEWMDDYIHRSCPGGESFLELIMRLDSFLNELQTQEDVLIITHGGIIRAAYHLLNKVPLNKLFDIEVEFGSLHEFELMD